MTLQEAKDQTAKKIGFIDWHNLYDFYGHGNPSDDIANAMYEAGKKVSFDECSEVAFRDKANIEEITARSIEYQKELDISRRSVETYRKALEEIANPEQYGYSHNRVLRAEQMQDKAKETLNK